MYGSFGERIKDKSLLLDVSNVTLLGLASVGKSLNTNMGQLDTYSDICDTDTKYKDLMSKYKGDDLILQIYKLDKDLQFEEEYVIFMNDMKLLNGDNYFETEEGIKEREMFKYRYLYKLLKSSIDV